MREELEEALEAIRQLRAEVRGLVPLWPEAWGLTRTEAALLALLARHEWISRELAFAAGIFSGRSTCERCVDLAVKKLRKKTGLRIKALYGQGYRLEEESRKMLRGENGCSRNTSS